MLNGIKKLFESSKGTMCLIILLISTVALWQNKLEGIYYAGIVSTIGVIFCHTRSKEQIAFSANSVGEIDSKKRGF
jgi:hypothetical protein